MEASRAKRLALLFLIVAVGAALRLFRIDAQSAWYDELLSVSQSARSLTDLLRSLTTADIHPPLHHLILGAWYKVAGFGAMEARLVSVIFGTFSIPLLYLLARRFTDSATSLCAAFLLAVSQIAVYFSQEARPYILVQFLSLAAALAFLDFIRNPNLRDSTLFALAGAGLLYTHYYSVWVLLALGLYWLVVRRRAAVAGFGRMCMVAVVIGVIYSPWLLLLNQSGGLNPQRGVLRSIHPSQMARASSPLAALNRFNSAKFGSIEDRTSAPAALVGFALFTAPAAAALWQAMRTGSGGAILGWLLAGVPVLAAVVVGFFGVVFNYRHYSFASAGYYLAVAIGWRLCFPNRAMRLLWLAAVLVVSGLALKGIYTAPTKPDYREGFLPLANHYQPGDCVTGQPRIWQKLVHYAWEVYYGERGTLRLVPLDQLPSVPAECGRLWLVWDRTWWMNRTSNGEQRVKDTIARMAGEYWVAQRHDHPAIQLHLLERKP